MKYIISFLILIVLSSSCSNLSNNELSTQPELSKIEIVNSGELEIEQSSKGVKNVTFDDCSISNIKMGYISYEISDTLVVGNSSIFSMIISKDEFTDEILNNLKINVDKVQIDEIRICDLMNIELFSKTKNIIEIQPITNHTQMIEDIGQTRWEWILTPLVPGTYELIFVVHIMIDHNIKNIKVKEHAIQIVSEDLTIMEIINSIFNFLLLNWEWLISSLVIPVIFFIFRNSKKK